MESKNPDHHCHNYFLRKGTASTGGTCVDIPEIDWECVRDKQLNHPNFNDLTISAITSMCQEKKEMPIGMKKEEW